MTQPEPKTLDVIVDPQGDSRHLIEETHDKVLTGFGEKDVTYRNSHVETWNDLSSAAKDWLLNKARIVRVVCDRPVINGTKSVVTNCFWADMLPVDGPVLGPYTLHSGAIAAEVAWLQENNLPLPQTSADHPDVDNGKPNDDQPDQPAGEPKPTPKG